MKINVLGTEYTVERCGYSEKPIFKERGIDGYCDDITKKIVICNLRTHPTYEADTDDYCRMAEKQILRHELIHAFFNESGLLESSLQYNGGWARNEEMIDWIAIQFPKMQKVFKDADCM